MAKKVVVGVNDIKTTHPNLLDEWDYEKNNKLRIFPEKVSHGSHEKVWWIHKAILMNAVGIFCFWSV